MLNYYCVINSYQVFHQESAIRSPESHGRKTRISSVKEVHGDNYLLLCVVIDLHRVFLKLNTLS